ncbi:MAG: hypothetical protein ACN6PJ_31340 [Achromobacter sp.]|uniref:hypothetical protein n=1 Tax=Achromobacter sp. TaxID=134375 RepID=UPI003D039799
MTKNNTAQPVLTDDEILHRWDAYVSETSTTYPLTGADKIAFARAIESALLSKLRAPVADERQALAHVANEWADMACNAMVWIRNIQDGISTPKEALVSLKANLTHCREVSACAGVPAALASAPVAGERCKRCGGPGWYTSHTTGYPHSMPCIDCNPQGVSAERLEKDPFLAAQLWRKPVGFADAYEGAREDLAIWKRRALEAERDLRAERETSSRLVAALNAENGPTHMGEPAPQASEAVRIQFPAHLRKMWSGGEVQAWLDEHQGVTPPKVSAKGSLERYRKWQAEREEAFGAGVKAAADLVKKTVEDYDANHGSTDCETGTREYPGEGATWVCEMQALEESIRALSAQPARKPATSAPSPAASQRQAMIPASRESGNSHTDGGAVYE